MSDVITLPPGAPTVPPSKRRWYLRPWFIIPAALVVIAAVVVTVVLVTLPATITVHGNVLDQIRPDLGVATATIKADGAVGKTDATGAFAMTGVPENGTLEVSAPYYRTTSVTATTRQLTIRLAPIPVGLTVTSALTGAPVSAAISAPAGKPTPYTIGSGGTLRLYRAGPGETLTVTANGYRPAQAIVTPNQTLTVALEPTPRLLWAQFATWAAQSQYGKIADWVFRPATGYTFLTPTPQEQAEMTKAVEHEFELYYTGRGIDGSSAYVDLVIGKTDTIYDNQANVQDAVGHASPVTIAGYRGWHGGPDSSGAYGTLVQVGTLELAAYGDSTAQTDQVLTKIVDTLLGRSTATTT